VGWCSEFGVEIASCDHPMVAGDDACHCEVCGTRCEGRFDGCTDVWARGPVQGDFVRLAPTRAKRNGSQSAHAEQDSSPRDIAWAPPMRHGDGIGEVLQSLQKLEQRLNTLEMTMLDSQSAIARSEVAELLEKLPRRLGQEIRAALDDREDARIDRLDDAISRLLDALVPLDVSANRAAGDGATTRTQRRRQSRATG
jgi:hypothetical protein